METKVTQTLAQYIARAKFEDLPLEIVHRAKQLILDNIGCAFGGYATDSGKILVAFAKEIGGKRESTIVGDGTRVSCLIGAGVNAQMANIMDFDDRSVTGHPGSAIVQTALALGERLKASGKEIIAATVMGYETVDRIASGVPDHVGKSHATPNAQPTSVHVFGPAAVAAKLLKLDMPRIKDTIGIAGAVAPTFNVLRVADRPASPTKTANLWNCWTGISAAFLAQKGFGGPVDYLDGPKGYWALFANEDEVNFGAMCADLGKRYMTAAVRSKPWSTCGLCGPAIQLASGIVRDERINPKDIAEIRVQTTPYNAVHPFTGQRPIEIWDAVFSIPWAVAMAVLGYEPGPDWYARERFSDPAVLNLTGKIKIEVLPEAEQAFKEKGLRGKSPTEVEIRTKGRAFVRRMTGAKGDAEQPMTDEEYRAKFRSLTNRSLDEERVERIINGVYKLEDTGSVTALTRWFKPV